MARLVGGETAGGGPPASASALAGPGLPDRGPSSGPALSGPPTDGNAPAALAGASRGPAMATDGYGNPPPGGNRYVGPPPGGNRYPPPSSEASDPQEPAPFRADPRAIPAYGARGAATERAALTPMREEPAPVEVSATIDGTGQPGGKHLEGPQSPQVTIQKSAPAEIQVGKLAGFRITVRNTGQAPAATVEVRDQVPKGTRLVGSTPRATRGPRGELVWNLGTMKPGEESLIDVQLMPTAEGEIGSVATVHFEAEASARSTATRPKLVVETTGVARALIGEEVALTFIVSNPGSGVATGVVLQEHIPAGLQHPAGSELEYAVGDLKPGESRKLELRMLANRPGPLTNVITARGDGNLRIDSRFDLEVASPQLDIALVGPKRRYLEREASYQVSISNPGTAPAQQVELVAYLPTGLKFISANNAGHYDAPNRAVYWRLEELPTNEKGTVELVTIPIEPGQQSIKVRATAQKGLAIEREQPVVVEGIAAVLFQVTNDRNPIEVGGETNYEIRVMNQGSKAASNVRVTVLLPPQMKPLAAEGPTQHAVDADHIQFEALGSLAPKTDVVYRVRAQGVQPGDLRVRFQMSSDEMQTPVTKEESIRVYADE
jgi:uncharacterized repeat protein (TIGR01451 family)